MSKAILLIDMPDNCSKCSLVNKHVCFITDKFIANYYGMPFRPNWCPLVKLPERSNTGKSDYYQWGDYEDGWNACIDELEEYQTYQK